MQIVAKDLNFTYNKGSKFAHDALKNVSLTIDSGDFFGIVGQTGSGKSTFVQHLNALIPIQSGSITVGDFVLTPKKAKKSKKQKVDLKELRKRVGMVFQYPEYQLFAETVFQDVAFGLKNFYSNLSEEEMANRVKKALETVGLNYDEIKDKSPFDLSGGQKRRVAIAGVLVFDPDVIVLDEPVAGLDPVGKEELWALLHSINSPEKTVVVVSHDMDDVLQNCNKVAVFCQGELITVGEPRKVFADASIIEKTGLDYPITKYLANGLKEVGFCIDNCPTVDEFIDLIAKKING